MYPYNEKISKSLVAQRGREGWRERGRGDFSDRVSYQWKKDSIMKPAKS